MGFTTVAVLAGMISCTAGAALADAPPGPGALGLVLGIPQMVGIGYERAVTRWLSVSAHAGTIFVMDGFGARLVLGGTGEEGLFPRASLGVAAVNSRRFDYPDDPEGIALYIWPSAGLELALPAGLSAVLEAGALLSGSEDTGLGKERSMSFSLGLFKGL